MTDYEERRPLLAWASWATPWRDTWRAAGHTVTVFNRTAAKAIVKWLGEHEFGAGSGEHRAELTPAKRRPLMPSWCSSAWVTTMTFAPLFTATQACWRAWVKGSVLVDHTTASADLARELAEACAKQGVGFLDAPVSGGQAGAENGQLTVMVGGEQRTFDAAQPVMDCFAKSVRSSWGLSGSGQLTKMVNQICIAGVLQGLAEGLHFAEQADLDIEAVVDVICKGAAQSWQMENRHQTMARKGEFEFGFAVDWMRKDLDITLNYRAKARCPAAAHRAGGSVLR